MAGEMVDVHVTVRAIMSIRKRDKNEAWFQYPSPLPVAEMPRGETDHDYLSVQLLFHGKENRDFVLNMVLSHELAKQLNLMVGDKLTLKMLKEGSGEAKIT